MSPVDGGAAGGRPYTPRTASNTAPRPILGGRKPATKIRTISGIRARMVRPSILRNPQCRIITLRYMARRDEAAASYYYEKELTTRSMRPFYVNDSGWSFTEEDYIQIPGFTHDSQSKRNTRIISTIPAIPTTLTSTPTAVPVSAR